jgi:hypothetical protein
MARKNDHVGWKNSKEPFGQVIEVLTDGGGVLAAYSPRARGLRVKLYNGKYTDVPESNVKVFKSRDIKTGREKD